MTLAAEARLSASTSTSSSNQVFRARRAGRLHHEHFLPADVLLDLDLHLAVAEGADQRLAQRHAQAVRDVLGQRAMRIAGKSSIGVDVSTCIPRNLTAIVEWLGRQDSNLRMRESKSRALTSLATPHL